MSDYCACDYGETADVWDVREVTARTSHVCTECGETIERAELYNAIAILFDGTWSHMKICEYCYHDWEVLQRLGLCVDLGDGDLREAWREAWQGGA